MRSSSNRKGAKAQFFVLSAFIIITILFVISQFLQPSGVFDTSSIVFTDEIFIFNNVKEKAIEVVQVSENCNSLSSNLNEYKKFTEDFVRQRNANIILEYNITSPCIDSIRQTNFYIYLVSTRSTIDSTFTASA